MKPLLFLTVRSFVNGIRRAVSSPQRLIGLLVFFGYYFMTFFQTLSPDSRRIPGGFAQPQAMLEFRPDVVQGVVFGILAFLSLLLLSSSFNPRGGFRASDVDVLFATPVNPRTVLVFRIVRDYLITLLIPLFLAILASRRALAGYDRIFRHFPQEGALAGRLFSISYLLMALCWVCIGYALSLFINRSDEASDRNKKIINVTLTVVVVAVLGYIAWYVRLDPSWDTALELSRSPFLRAVFFTATAATAVVMAPFHNSVWEGLAGTAAMLAIILFSLRTAMTQVDYLYDQAAAKGFASTDMRRMQRSGDTYAIVAEQARQGKVKGGRIARVIGRWRFRGSAALLWKELLLQARGAMWQYVIFTPMVLSISLMPLWAMSKRGNVHNEGGMLMAFLAIGVLSLTISNSTSGFMELLRRVDFQKPLPFSPAATVFAEVVGKTVPTFVISTITGVGATIIDYRIWAYSLAAILMATTLALTWAAVSLLVILLFPDVDDAAQRGFRGMLLLIGCVLTALVPVGMAIGLFVLKLFPLVTAIPFVAVCLAISFGISAIAGGLYGSFNPSE
ncbi:putative ABC exporter domain-containing protein [Fimbriimonas ginsengisoli]|uniref:ABC transporter, permease protein n=1 Tax=Fimbriimonas ginsengisoli Gsoil 348 TaxID=661478 RepID=A0A068NXR3_FIMGI|nr:putative ABC exporter domain-containing protein [Fimbriimonas ginsengisoli]AIE86434.1 ABC transporter, permease protein [Fimbriimonas ginsengisoli Gsoil 348]